MSLFSVIVVPPAMLILRKMIRRIKTIAHHQFTGSTRILETLQETVQGIRIVKAFTLEDAHARALRRQRRRARAGIEQMGAGRLPLQPADGGARRLRDRDRADLRRLPRDRDRRDAGPVLLVPRRLHAGLRAGQAARAPQHRSQQRRWSACASCSTSSTIRRPSSPTTTSRRCSFRPRASSSPTCNSPTARARR